MIFNIVVVCFVPKDHSVVSLRPQSQVHPHNFSLAAANVFSHLDPQLSFSDEIKVYTSGKPQIIAATAWGILTNHT